MKSKLQKQKEALARIVQSMESTTASIERNRIKAKAWRGPPPLSEHATVIQRLFHQQLSSENPFLSLVSLGRRDLERLEAECQRLKSKIGNTT